MQGVVRPTTRSPARASSCATPTAPSYDLAADALEGSIFRMLRQGQRVVFDLDAAGRATALRLGSEVDMGTPGVDAVHRRVDRHDFANHHGQRRT